MGTGEEGPGEGALEGQDTRVKEDNILQPPASGNLPETGERSLYELDLGENTTQQLKEERQMQEDAKQEQELQTFQVYLHEHGLKEEETDPFGNCLFFSLSRQVVPMQEGVYSTTSPGDTEDSYKTTVLSIRNQALEYMLSHHMEFEDSFGRRISVMPETDPTTTSTETDVMTKSGTVMRSDEIRGRPGK